MNTDAPQKVTTSGMLVRSAMLIHTSGINTPSKSKQTMCT